MALDFCDLTSRRRRSLDANVTIQGAGYLNLARFYRSYSRSRAGRRHIRLADGMKMG
jgi:hypothetical protein